MPIKSLKRMVDELEMLSRATQIVTIRRRMDVLEERIHKAYPDANKRLEYLGKLRRKGGLSQTEIDQVLDYDHTTTKFQELTSLKKAIRDNERDQNTH